jgi:gliding motility-associated-like protein
LPDPSHFYQAGFNTDSADFPIVLTVKNSRLGCVDSASAWVRIGNPLLIPNLISPNGDELNDAFWIRGILPAIWKLDVFDRWGKRVYSTPAYDLNWKGDQLVSGVYFYVLKNPDGNRQFSGWIEIVK